MFISNYIKFFVEFIDLLKFLVCVWNVKKKIIERNDYDVCILFYGNFCLFKMCLDGFLLCFFFGVIFMVLIFIEVVEEFGCLSNCYCSIDFIVVKCFGMEVFFVFNFLWSV